MIDWVARGSSAWVDLPHGTQGWVCRGMNDGPFVVVTAGIHGDEYEGPVAAARLTRELRPEAVCGCVAILPVANPMAYHAGLRVSPEDGKNLARTFPGDPRGSITERLAASLFDWISRADYLIDLHSGGVEYVFSPLAGFYGEPTASNPSFEAARRFGLPLLWQLPETNGVLSYELWRRGVTTIGCEYLGRGQLSAEGAEAYVRGVQSCLAHWDVLPNKSALHPDGEVVRGDWMLAEATGIFHPIGCLNELVSPGQPLARISNEQGDMIQELSAGYAGMVIALRNKAFIRKGDWGVLLATVP